MTARCNFSPFNSQRSTQGGQLLVELLIVIALTAILLPALLTGWTSTRGGRAQTEQRVQALALLRETEEAVKSVRNDDWARFATLSGALHPVISGSKWTLVSGVATSSGLTQQVVISDVYRDTNGALVSNGGMKDASTKKADITISWTQPSISSTTSTIYFTRTANTTQTHTTAADFSPGIFTQTQLASASGGEVKLGNDNKAKWCSPSFSSTSIDLPDGPPVAVAATASAVSTSIPNDVFVATAPNTSSSVKLAYVNVTANVASPTATLRGTFTLDSAKYSNASHVPTGIGLNNTFKTNDVKYYTSAAGKLYALMATDLPDKEVIAILINDGDPSNDNTNNGEYQDYQASPKIYKYWTYFNTKIYTNAVKDTDFHDPTSNASDTGGDGNGFLSNPTRAYTDNASFAVDTDSGNGTGTDCAGVDKDRHRYYDYDLSLPSGVAINGIEVRLDAKVDNTTGSPKMCVQMSWDGGTTWTSTKSTSTLTTSEATYALGGAADTWGRTWSDTNFTNTNFRLRVINVASNISRDFSLDWAAVKVYYDTNDYAPHGYGGTSLAVLGTRGYISSGGYLYTFDLSNIDTKSASNGLDMVGCRIELDGYDCKPGSPAVDKKYNAGGTDGTWGDIGSPAHNDCSDGGNIELNATNDIYAVKSASGTYVFAAVGAGTNPEFAIANVSSVPTSGTSPAISNNSCGRISGGASGWKRVGSYDFNSNSGTEEAANSVFAKSDGTRAYISSNGGASSKQFYILNTTDPTNPTFLSGSPSTGPGSGYYNGASPAPVGDSEMYPRRSLTVLNGLRAILVGKDGVVNTNNAEEYQVLELDNPSEASPKYCKGLNYDQGFNDLTSVSELDSDNFVYMVANTAVNELKIIEGGVDGAIYVPSGTFESKPFDATASSAFNRFVANISLPSATNIAAQLAVAPPGSNGCSNANYQYIGPNGTSSPTDLFLPNGASISAMIPFGNYLSGLYQNPERCFRYKTWFTSNPAQSQTPILYDTTWNYSQ